MKKISPWIASILLAMAIAPGLAFADEAVEKATNEPPATQQGSQANAAPAQSEPAAPDSTPAGTTEGTQSGPADSEPASTASTPAPSSDPAPTPESTPQTPAAESGEASVEPVETPTEAPEAQPEGDNAISTPSDDAPAAAGYEGSTASVSMSETEVSAPAAAAKTAAPAPVASTASTKPASEPAQAKKPSAAAKPAASDRTEAAGYYLNDGDVFVISSALAAKGKLVLDVAKGSSKSGANVQIYKGNTTRAQFWRAVYKGNGIYNFVNYAGNKLLAVSGAIGDKVNVNVKTSGNVGWKLLKHANGSFSIIPANSSKTYYLSVYDARAKSGTNVRTFNRIANNGQRFFFTKYSALGSAYKAGNPVKSGIVNIALASKSAIRVDVAGGSTANRANVQSEKSSNSMSQRFQVVSYGNGLYALVNIKSGKALDVANGSTKAGANVQQYSRNGSLAQMWYLVKSGAGYQIRSAKSGLALSLKGASPVAKANIQIAKATGAATQVFTLKGTQLIANGTYVLQSAIAMPMVLDIQGGSMKSGANAQIYRSNGSAAQKFRIKHIGNGIYTIASAKSGMFLDVRNGSKDNGANVWMYKGNNSKAQQWRAEYTSRGIMFKSVVSGRYLDVSGGRIKSGTNVQQWGDTDSTAQCWVLRDSNWSFYKNVSSSNMKIIRKAEEYEGWPYQWGGRSPSTSFDCAGLVMYCSNKAWGTNFDLMFTNAEMLYYKCKPILASEAKPGDLVFYRGTYGDNVNYISHVVFYVGRGYMYGAGDPIGYAPVNSITNIYGNRAQTLYARIYH